MGTTTIIRQHFNPSTLKVAYNANTNKAIISEHVMTCGYCDDDTMPLEIDVTFSDCINESCDPVGIHWQKCIGVAECINGTHRVKWKNGCEWQLIESCEGEDSRWTNDVCTNLWSRMLVDSIRITVTAMDGKAQVKVDHIGTIAPTVDQESFLADINYTGDDHCLNTGNVGSNSTLNVYSCIGTTGTVSISIPE